MELPELLPNSIVATDLGSVRVGLRKLLKEGRVSPASVLACRELVALALSPTADEGTAAATVAQAMRFAVESLKERDAVEALFGLAPSTDGEPLQVRRKAAAALLGIKGESFRVRRESQLLDRIARALVVELSKPRSNQPPLRAGRRPRLFVSTSSNSAKLVEGLSLSLNGKADLTSWSSTGWSPSRNSLEAMERTLGEADFAVFVLSEDDIVSAQVRQASSRDNLLLELGLSIGLLGRDRTLVLASKEPSPNAHLASDLMGISTIYYEGGNDQATVSWLAGRIWEEIQAWGPRNRMFNDQNLERGNTDHLDVLTDAVVELEESRGSYADELGLALQRGQRIPAKFLFAHTDGGRHWLRLCRSINYRYFHRAMQDLSSNASHLAETVRQAAGTAAVDLISLGCGDGSKDDVLLRALADELAGDEYLYYYPVEISDILLVEALRFILRHGLDRSRFRCKPILGDFTNLRAFNSVLEYRPNTSLFSVLGNTIGSFDESDILSSLNGAMRPGDLLLIEANVGQATETTFLSEDEVTTEWDLNTLDALGIPRASCELGTELREDISTVPGTETLLRYASHTAKPAEKYMLAATHYYDFEQFRESVGDSLGLKWIDATNSGEVGLLLGQRPR